MYLVVLVIICLLKVWKPHLSCFFSCLTPVTEYIHVLIPSRITSTQTVKWHLYKDGFYQIDER